MKKTFVLIIAVFFLVGVIGCASTLSMKGADGSVLTLSNYAVTEVFSSEGKLVQRVMVPDNSLFAGILDKLSSLWQSISNMATGTVKTVVPAILPGK